MLVAVNNTCETIEEVLQREFKDCSLYENIETVFIDSVEYKYYPAHVHAMPHDDITVYELIED